MSCLDANLASELVAGNVSAPARAAALDHLDGCGECRRLISALAAVSPSPVAAGPTPSDRVGRYLLLDRLGAGAMGVVWAAYDPQLDRKVAIKLIRPGRAPEVLRERLLREAQAMARLSHPGVVAVHDVGAEDGQVYVAMELIDGPGATLGAWLAARPRPWREVVRVFLDAGRGLAAAHAAGVTHRDFKPDNVLVRRDGRVAVSDFGLARSGEVPEPPAAALEREVAPRITVTGALLGTPAYMAPEQHRGGEADARSDQFAFSVALHEALAGELPFAGRTVAEFAEAVCAGRRRAPRRRLPAPVQRVLARGLAPRPQDRYPSMDALLGDLSRDPWRSGRRALWAAGALGVAAVGLSLFLRSSGPPACADAGPALGGIWDAARRQEVAAAFSASGRKWADGALRAVDERLDAYTERWKEARVEICRDTRVRRVQPEDVMTRGLGCLDDRLRELSALVAVLAAGGVDVVDQSAKAVGDLTSIEVCVDPRLAGAPEPSDPATRVAVAALRERLAVERARVELGDVARAAPVLAGIAEEARQTGYRPLVAAVLYEQALASSVTSDGKQAEELLDEVVWNAEAGHDDYTAAMGWLALAATAVGDSHLEVAARGLRRGSAAVERAGRPPVLVVALERATGEVRFAQGRYAESADSFRRALELGEPILGAEPLAVLRMRGQLALSLRALGRLDEAAAELHALVATGTRALGPDHPALGPFLENLGAVEEALGQTAPALADLRHALAITDAARGPNSRNAIRLADEVGALELEAGQLDAALATLQGGYAAARASYGAASEETAMAATNLAIALDRKGRASEAEALFREALVSREHQLGASHPSVALTLVDLAELLYDRGALDESIADYRRALVIELASHGADHADVVTTRLGLAAALRASHHAALALDEAQQALAADARVMAADDPRMVEALVEVGEDQLAAGHPVEAAAVLERAAALAERPEVALTTGAEARFALAQALPADHARARALALAENARATFARAGADREERAVAAWLARHR